MESAKGRNDDFVLFPAANQYNRKSLRIKTIHNSIDITSRKRRFYRVKAALLRANTADITLQYPRVCFCPIFHMTGTMSGNEHAPSLPACSAA